MLKLTVQDWLPNLVEDEFEVQFGSILPVEHIYWLDKRLPRAHRNAPLRRRFGRLSELVTEQSICNAKQEICPTNIMDESMNRFMVSIGTRSAQSHDI
jgi:hypothetical protein